MKSQVFKVKENHELLTIVLPVSVIFFMAILVASNQMVNTVTHRSNYEHKYFELQSNPVADQDVVQSENASAVINTLEMRAKEFSQPVVEEPLELEAWMLTIENEAAVINALEMRAREFLQRAIEEPLELEGWMLTTENESAVFTTLEMKAKEFSQPLIEKPLELKDWMMNEKYWRTEPKTLAITN